MQSVERQASLAYNIEFDRRRPINEAYIKRQVETHIGERLNVLLSRTRYELRDGIIYGEKMSEPFIDVLKRGRDFRRREGSVDWQREDAEVLGFSKIQDVLGDPETSVGTMMLSISPQGKEDSIYQHNFYDIFTLKSDHKGRYIEARRYSSALTYEDYQSFFEDLTQQKIEEPSDVFFLANPIIVNNFTDPDEVHRYLHREHEYLSEKDFRRIIDEFCATFILGYIRALIEGDLERAKLYFNGALNRAEKAKDDLRKTGHVFTSIAPIEYWGTMEVRQVMTGCGSSGGFSLSKGITTSPFSVSEFSGKFVCPRCGGESEPPIGNSCPKCGITKEKWAKENPNQVCA